ncbi:hypothetical protein HDU96_010499 [Phlyctochytrium bullatum]|nr:hypothetical protein HDU96_010499 [Phlyctochytrium bullatum]
MSSSTHAFSVTVPQTSGVPFPFDAIKPSVARVVSGTAPKVVIADSGILRRLPRTPPPGLEPSAIIDLVLQILLQCSDTVGGGTTSTDRADVPLTMIGELLVARYALLHPETPGTDDGGVALKPFHPIFFLVMDPEPSSDPNPTLAWATLTDPTLLSRVHGICMLNLGRRANAWFRAGPGAPSTPQRRLVFQALTELVSHAHVEGSGTLADADIWVDPERAQFERSVFFAALDSRYCDVLEEVVEKVYREPPALQYVFPWGAEAGKEVTDVGEAWRVEGDEAEGAEYVMDRTREEDFDTVFSSILVQYHRNYVTRALSREPFLSMSRVARLAQPLTDTLPGPAASWCLTHINLIIGLTSTSPAHRRRGLAARVCLSQAVSQQRWLQEHHRWVVEAGAGAVAPQCYVFVSNKAGQGMFAATGFRQTPEREFCWMAVRPRTA